MNVAGVTGLRVGAHRDECCRSDRATCRSP